MKPALVTKVSPANTLVAEEIFGPVLVAMSFRTPEEAVALANNTRYGLAATVWSENINLALDIAPKLKAGVVWINGTNQFDAAVGFGGYKESGYGREGGREGMAAYLKPLWEKDLKPAKALPAPPPQRPIRSIPAISTRRPRCMSAASRQGRIRATIAPSMAPEASSWARSARAIARTSATPWRPPARPPAGPRRRPIPARKCFISLQKISITGAMNSLPASRRRPARMAGPKSLPRSSGSLLLRLGGQV